MGADRREVTFKDCVSKTTPSAAYDMGGLAGMIQRGNGVDNASVENCTVENITVDFDPRSTYVDVKGTATLKSNDQPSGTDMTKAIDGKYLDEERLLLVRLREITMSPYGDSSYDAPGGGVQNAPCQQQYCVNK